MTRVHAFTDDSLGTHDAVGLAELLRSGAVSAAELAAASQARLAAVEQLNPVAYLAGEPQYRDTGVFAGVPTFVKDNVTVAAMPANHGSHAWTARPAKKDDPYIAQFRGTGLTVLGRSRMPEFGLNASTEFTRAEPVRNPWDTEYSAGGSSGGAAALVASGVVPIAHGNDGGGSIRIPSAATGLVGLKPTRGRHVSIPNYRTLPVKLVSEGVLTRTVRDTAAFHAAIEVSWRCAALPPIGEVHGPGNRKLRIGMLIDSVTGVATEDSVRQGVLDIATLLESNGHSIEPVSLPVTAQFADDFTLYWAMLAALLTASGQLTLDRSFDQRKLEPLTLGLAAMFARNAWKAPLAIRRLRQTQQHCEEWMSGYDAILSPVLSGPVPKLGHLNPGSEIGEILPRLRELVAFTPLNNVAGSPGLTMPTGLDKHGLPRSVQLSGSLGSERTLLEIGYEIEAAGLMPTIY